MKILGVILMIASLACIIYTFIHVATGKAAIFSLSSICGYLVHPVAMIAGVLLIQKGRKARSDREAE